MSEIDRTTDLIEVDNLIIRRSELEDLETLNALRSQEEDTVIDLLYNHPKLETILETSYLSITVLDPEENIVGCIAFEAYPDVITGLNDFKHENLWEEWLYKCFNFDQNITPYNSLWVSYIFVGQGIEGVDEKTTIDIVKKVFRYVYNTAPEIEFLLFHLRKEAHSSRVATEYVKPILAKIFRSLELRQLTDLDRGNMNVSSRVYVSHRSYIIDILEIREALEQDHDDLVEVCNQQSELHTELYGEFFIAELIAHQNETRKAIVAQVGSKAIGMMSLSTELDYEIMSRNFELETYDNLCKTEFMDAIILRRNQLAQEKALRQEKNRRDLQRKIADEVKLCSIVSNRIILQQHCIEKREEIIADINKYLETKDEAANSHIKDKAGMTQILNKWLDGFEILQPSSFFLELEVPYEETDLSGHIDSSLELFLETLSYFGLHERYIDGEGQWKNYAEEQLQKLKKTQKRNKMSSTKKSMNQNKNKNSKYEKNAADIEKPKYYDWKPLEEAFRNFIDMGAEIRTRIRVGMEDEEKKIHLLFCNDNGEEDPDKKMNILEIAGSLQNLAVPLQPNQIEGFGWILECFGGCKYDVKIEKVEEKTEDDTLMKNKRKKFSKLDDKKMIDKITKLTTYKQFQEALETAKDYDETLMRLGKIESSTLQKKVQEKLAEEEELWEAALQSLEIKDIDNEFYHRIQNMDEDEIMQNVPENAKNAVCVNIFFMNEEYECRAIDFLPFAMSLFEDKEYIIVTQPYSAEENVLLQSFIQVPRRVDTNLEHCLYIFNRANLMSPFLYMRKSLVEDLEEGQLLFAEAKDKDALTNDIKDGIVNNASNKVCFTCFSEDAVVGFFVLTKDVNLEYYKSHFSIQYHMQLQNYALTDHTRLLHSIVNPLFQRQRRFMLRELLRLTDKKAIFFETEDKTILLDVFDDMIHVRNRKFPHFLERKWDLEKDEEYVLRMSNNLD